MSSFFFNTNNDFYITTAMKIFCANKVCPLFAIWYHEGLKLALCDKCARSFCNMKNVKKLKEVN